MILVKRHIWIEPYIPSQGGTPLYPAATPTMDQFLALQRDVQELKELLRKAKINEPDCENEEKYRRLQKIADLVGIDLGDVLKFHIGKGGGGTAITTKDGVTSFIIPGDSKPGEL